MKEINERYFVNDGNIKKKKVEELLNKNEKILWKGCPKRSSYALNSSIKLMPIGILWGLIDFGLLFGIISTGSIPFQVWFIIIPFFALHLAPFWIWIYKLVKASREMKNTQYVITNKRIIEIKGDMGYISASVGFSKFFKATLARNWLDRFLKVGDIYIKSSTNSLVLFDIPDSEFIWSRIQEISLDKEKEVVFYDNKVECEHCGSYFDTKEKRCPNCGAPYKKEN